MSIATASAAIRSRFETEWANQTPVQYQNEKGEPPTDSDGMPTPWVFLEVMWTGGDMASIGAPGSNFVRREGLIWLHVFVPNGSGDATAMATLAAAMAVFEGEDFSGVVCEAAQPGGGDSATDDGNWWRESASIPFHYDETA